MERPVTDTAWQFAKEGRADVPGGRIWYGIVGDLNSGKTPLLVIHGGPGMAHDYLHPLVDLADERAVIFYDQLDAGLSDRPNDPNNWNISRFLKEIDVLRDVLGLNRVSIFGNSWGGTLAAAYAATQPEGLENVILSSPLLRTETWITDNNQYRAELPENVRSTMDACEAEARTDSQEYQDAVGIFYSRHLCRIDPWPDYVLKTFEEANLECYGSMWGLNEFTCTGTLKGYDSTENLGCIKAPTLMIVGEFDEATPASSNEFADLIPNCEFVVVEDASHLAFVEKRGVYMSILRKTLAVQSVRGKAPSGTAT